MTEAKQRVLAELGPRFGFELDADRALGEQLDAAFGRAAPHLLDVGIGKGEATIAWALAHPDRDVVAAELHRPGVAATLEAIEAQGLTNVRVAEIDVRTLLTAARPGDLTEVRILFPDPWPKRRHLNRRLIDEGFVTAVADVLPVGGTLQVATDWVPYANQVARSMAADPRLIVDPDAPRPDRPVTVYESVGIAAGRKVTDLAATRR